MTVSGRKELNEEEERSPGGGESEVAPLRKHVGGMRRQARRELLGLNSNGILSLLCGNWACVAGVDVGRWLELRAEAAGQKGGASCLLFSKTSSGANA